MVSDAILGLIVGGAVGIVGILATLASALLSSKSEERRLTIQLQSDETKKAIVSLHGLMMESQEIPLIHASNITKFLSSMDSAYLPQPVRKWATKKLGKLWAE